MRGKEEIRITLIKFRGFSVYMDSFYILSNLKCHKMTVIEGQKVGCCMQKSNTFNGYGLKINLHLRSKQFQQKVKKYLKRANPSRQVSCGSRNTSVNSCLPHTESPTD